MKIILPVKEDNLDSGIDNSLGRCNYFLVYDVEKGKDIYIENKAKTSQGGAGIGAGQIIVDSGSKALLTPRCGIKAGKVLDAGGIEIYETEGSNIKENIDRYISGHLNLLRERTSSKKSGGL